MRTWTIAELETSCGFCGEPVEAGRPVLRVTLPGIDRPRFRCQLCAVRAGAEVDDTAIEAERARLEGLRAAAAARGEVTAATRSRWKRVPAHQVFDHKAAAAGDRDE